MRGSTNGVSVKAVWGVWGVLLLVVACPPPADTEIGDGSGAEPPPIRETYVETVSLERTVFRDVSELVGETEPIVAAAVCAQMPGRITDFELEVGDEVTERDVVLRVDTSTTLAQIPALEVQVRALDVEIARTERLIEQGLAPSSMLEQLEAQREATEEGIDAIDTAADMGRTRAPISGTVIETSAEEGEFAFGGFQVARIADMSTIVVRVGLPERDILHVQEGMTVLVRIDALGLERQGTLHQIGYEANLLNRTFPLEIHVDNGDGDIRIGMRATVFLTKQVIEDAVVIPRDALLRTFEGQEVFVVEDGVAWSREVELGLALGPFVVIMAGLNPGDELVLRGQRNLLDGRLVNVVATSVCCDAQLTEYIEEQ